MQSLSDRGSSSRQVSRPSSLGSSISDIRGDENVGVTPTPTTPITAHPVAAAAAALAAGAMNANGEIDYKKVSKPKSNQRRNHKTTLNKKKRPQSSSTTLIFPSHLFQSKSLLRIWGGKNPLKLIKPDQIQRNS